MSPRRVDAGRLHAKLARLREVLDALASLGPLTADELRTDVVQRAATERLVTQAVDIAVDINSHLSSALLGRAPATYRASFAAAAEAGVLPPERATRLAGSAGLRNVVVHEYLDVDLELLADSVPLTVAEFGEYVRDVAQWLAAHPT